MMNDFTTTTREVWTPPGESGRSFEEAILHRGKSLEKDGELVLDRYGVKASFVDGEWVAKQSYPDFCGSIAPDGQSLIIEAKTCTQASFKLGGKDNKLKKHQLRFMIRRSRVGALCFLMIHFNLIVLKTKTHEEFTVAFQVSNEVLFWQDVMADKIKSISRADAKKTGIPVPWNYHSNRSNTLTPDLRALLPGYRPVAPERKW